MKQHETPIAAQANPETPQLQQYDSLVRQGIENASKYDFNLHLAVASGLPEGQTANTVNRRVERIITTTSKIASDLEIHDTFFERTANVVLLTAIAESWITNEDATRQNGHNLQLADEREMLVDISMLLAGNNSGVVQKIAAENPYYADRYIAAKADQNELERTEFYESINDPILAVKVTDVLNADGDGSFLHTQREQLGITAQTQEALQVRVLKIRDHRNLKEFGFFDGKELSEEQVAEQAQEYEDAATQYKARFAENHGDLGAAFIKKQEDGSSVLYIKGVDAQALLHYFVEGRPLPDSLSQDSLDRQFAITRHEYTHTQKFMPIGPHQQLGLAVEERRAELFSGDKMGYKDVKHLFTDIVISTGVNLVELLREAAKSDDSMSDFVSGTANALGLRTALMLVADKPLDYNDDTTFAEKFANLRCITEAEDVSTHDAIVRESLAVYGETEARRKIGEWAGSLATQPGFDFLHDNYVHRRKSAGSGHISNLMQNALDKAADDKSR